MLSPASFGDLQAKAFPAQPRTEDERGPIERPFVGRRDEMAELRRGLDAVLGGKSAAFAITGEAGVGKTRLADEFARIAREAGAHVAWGRCWEAGGAPSYWPWVEVIRHLVGDQAAIDLGARGPFLAQLLPELSERLGVAGQAPPSPTDPESARFLMFDAVGELLRRVTVATPLVVVIDDVHAADRASLLLLAFLARSLTDRPLLLIATYRAVEASLAVDLAQPLADVERHARKIHLHGLTTDDISTLLRSASGAGASAALAEHIHDVTAGNAFYVEEVLRTLPHATVLDPGATPPPLGVPDGIRAAVHRWLERMPPASVAALELAAVIGREFDASVVGIAGGQASVEVLHALDVPVRLGIIAELPRQAGRFQFRHALIRDALYEDLPAARRLGLHQAVGEAFATLSGAAPDRYLAELAHHFLMAAPTGDERFVEHAVRAARQAFGRSAFEEAASLYQRAIDALVFTRPDERRRCELLLGLAEAKEWTVDLAGSRSAFETAAEIARQLDATDLFVAAALGIGAAAARKFTATSRCESAPSLLHEALQRIDEGDTIARARLLSRLALNALSAGARDEAFALSIQAVATARTSGDLETVGGALSARHAVLFGPDALEERAAIAEEVLRIGRRLSRPDLVLRGHAIRFTIRFECGDIALADQDLEAHRLLAEELCDPFDRWANLVWRAMRVLLEGRFDEARKYSALALDLVQHVPGPHSTELNGPASFVAQQFLIEDTATEPLVSPDAAREFGSRYPEVSTWRLASLIVLTRLRDAPAVAREIDNVAGDDFRDFERNGVWLVSLSLLSEAIELVGDAPRAALVYELLLPYADRNATGSLVASCGPVSRVLGLLAATMGRWPDAEQHFRDARAMNERMGADPHLAKTLFDHGRLLVRHLGEAGRDRGATLVEEGLAIARRLAMPGLIESCERFVAELTAAPSETGAASDEPRLRKIEGGWILDAGGETCFLKDARGLAYIAELLRNPGREIRSLDLVTSVVADGGDRIATIAEHSHPGSEVAGHGAPLVDAKARHAYRRRLRSLADDAHEAEAAGDPERLLAIREEIAALDGELARAEGLGGRIRHTSDAERARVSVTRAIRLALSRIADVSPASGARLAAGIRTGTFCTYAPLERA